MVLRVDHGVIPPKPPAPKEHDEPGPFAWFCFFLIVISICGAIGSCNDKRSNNPK